MEGEQEVFSGGYEDRLFWGVDCEEQCGFCRSSGSPVVIDLANGCTYAFPARLAQDLHDASDEALAGVAVDGLGFNLHWPALDADLYSPALVAGIFGTRSWMMRELARAAGQAKSPAKAATSRSNGAKGGRPRKAARG
jgi:hypothetical protein